MRHKYTRPPLCKLLQMTSLEVFQLVIGKQYREMHTLLNGEPACRSIQACIRPSMLQHACVELKSQFESCRPDYGGCELAYASSTSKQL